VSNRSSPRICSTLGQGERFTCSIVSAATELGFQRRRCSRLSAAPWRAQTWRRRPPYQAEPPSRRDLPAPVAHVILCLIACRMRQRLLVIKHRAVIEDVEITTEQSAFGKCSASSMGCREYRIARRNCLPFTPKWIGRYDRRVVKMLPRSWLFNAITRNNRPSVIFTNQPRSRCRRAAGGSGFGYMRNGQKKKDHECCAAHFSFLARILLLGHSDEEREGAGHALLIWSYSALRHSESGWKNLGVRHETPHPWCSV
jgi:hypothetical protein